MTREEAIEIIKRNCIPGRPLREACEMLIPELAESEGEKIIKEIIHYLYTSEGLSTEEQTRWISYLGKQKESIEKEYVFRPLGGTDINIAAEQAIGRANKGDRLVLAFNGAYIPISKGCTVTKIVDTYDAFIEKQKETKHAPCDLQKAFEDGQASIVTEPGKYGLQKIAEWSEEDEKMVETICKEGDLKPSEQRWLKSLKNRGNFSKSNTNFPSWNAEDERMLNVAIHSCEQIIEDYPNDKVRFNDCINWLKSLRPQPQQNMSIYFMLYLDEHRPDGKMCLSNAECNQIEVAFKNQDWDIILKYAEKYLPHWKPSASQLMALDGVKMRMSLEGYGLCPDLQSLLDDLRKLM